MADSHGLSKYAGVASWEKKNIESLSWAELLEATYEIIDMLFESEAEVRKLKKEKGSSDGRKRQRPEWESKNQRL